MRKILIIIETLLLAILLVLGACAPAPTPPPSEPAPAPTPTPAPAPIPKKITLADAPMVLDMSNELPAYFEHVDAASEGLSNKDMGLGPDWSEVEVFFSEKPYQLLLTYLTIVESKIEQGGLNAIIEDEQQIESMVIAGLKAEMLKEGIEIGEPEIKITYPDIADLAVSGEGYIITSQGISMGYNMIWFRSNKVYVFIESVSLSSQRQSLIPIVREIAHRISMFSQ